MIHPPLEPVLPADLPLVARMAEKIWPEVYGEIISAEQMSYMLNLMYSEESMRAEMISGRANYCWINAEGEPVGFCAYGPLEKSVPCEIHKLYLLPDCRGKGSGKQTVSSIERSALQIESSHLELRVNRENTQAIGFYQACGFLNYASDCKDIGNGFVMDDFIFRKQLEEGRVFSS